VKRISPVILATLFCAVATPFVRAEVPLNGLTEAEKRGGWQLLFDGKTTDGWRNYKSDKIGGGWVVEDGVLSRAKGGAGDILTTGQYENFELSIEYRISKGGNSGIMFHVTEEESTPWRTGPEVQIQDNVDGHDPQKSGWLYQLYKPVKPAWVTMFENQVGYKSPAVPDATRPAGQWNHVYLRVTPQQGEVAVNGVSYYYFQKGSDDWNQRVAKSKFAAFPKFGKATKGYICLQDHGNPVSFRNIKIRETAADGSVPDPVDGQLPLKVVEAFPQLQWEGWDGADADGKLLPLRPITLTHANDDSNRIFVATQRGAIHVFENSPSASQTKLFLDITSKVHDWRKDNEEGMLGLAFHPNYKKNGQFFVSYTSEAELHTSIISRFSVSKRDPNLADPDSEQIVIKIPQPFANHNGGSIAFGPDGYLYIGLGDGGHRNDELRNGQNLETWMGSILRIDVGGQDGDRGYAIPKDNPFVDRPQAKPEIYAYGFRNIWRLSFDRKTGSLWAGDVGQDLWEEIHIVRRGGNYGWNSREGSYAFGNAQYEVSDEPIDPVWEYDHRTGKSITGGFVYRGSRLPALQGHYLYADYVSGRIWALHYDEAAGKVVKNWRIPSTPMAMLAFGEDAAGEVYCLVESGNGRGIFRFDRAE
jgi:glucose/arabinose dehydrogenase